MRLINADEVMQLLNSYRTTGDEDFLETALRIIRLEEEIRAYEEFCKHVALTLLQMYASAVCGATGDAREKVLQLSKPVVEKASELLALVDGDDEA